MDYYNCLSKVQQWISNILLVIGFFLVVLTGETELLSERTTPSLTNIAVGLIGLAMMFASAYMMNVVGKKRHRRMSKIDLTGVDWGQL